MPRDNLWGLVGFCISCNGHKPFIIDPLSHKSFRCGICLNKVDTLARVEDNVQPVPVHASKYAEDGIIPMAAEAAFTDASDRSLRIASLVGLGGLVSFKHGELIVVRWGEGALLPRDK